MAYGIKTKPLSIEKGDKFISRGETSVFDKNFNEFDTVSESQLIGFATGITKNDSDGLQYQEIVLPTATNNDGSPDFTETKYYILASIAKFEANPKYDYVAGKNTPTTKPKTDWLGTISTILISAGGLLGIIKSGKDSKSQTQTDTENNEDPTPAATEEKTFWEKYGLYVIAVGVLSLAVGGYRYIQSRNKKPQLN